MTTAPQKIAIRRLVRGADGTLNSILVDAYSYTPVTDTTGYKVVDVSDVPEQVQDASKPDAEKPVKNVDKTVTNSIRGGSEFGGSSRGGQNDKFGKAPSTSAPSRAHVNQSFPSAPSNPASTPAQSVPSAPSVGTGTTQDSGSTTGSPVSAPSAPSATPSAPGYSNPNPSTGFAPTNYSPANPNAAAFAAGNAYYTGNTKTYDFSNPNTAPSAPSAPAPSTEPGGYQAQGQATPRNIGDYNPGTGFSNTAAPSYSSPSGNNNGRGTGIAATPSPSAPSAYGGLYSGNVGFGGGLVPDSQDTSTARSTVEAASAPKSATERSQAMGAVPDSATSPAAAAARGLTNRTPAQLDRIGLTIAGEVTQQTLADLSSPDPAAQAAAKAQVANIQATMENRAATAPWGTIENALTPSQYNSLTPGKQLNTSTKNYASYNAALSQTVKDFYSGLNPPTNYDFTNYANTNPIPGKYAPPGWLNTIQDPTVVGPFTFGTDPAYANPSRYTAEAQANYAAATADYGAAGAYQKSADYGTDPGWGTFADPSNPNNGYSYGAQYGQSAVSPGWGAFAGAVDNPGDPFGGSSATASGSGGGYSSSSGNGNGRGSGIGNGGSGNYGGSGGNSSTGGGSGYGGGSAGNGTGSGGGAGMSGGGGYSPGGMGSPSGSSSGGGGYGTSSGSSGNNSGTGTGGGAGTNGSGGSKGAQGRSDGDY